MNSLTADSSVQGFLKDFLFELDILVEKSGEHALRFNRKNVINHSTEMVKTLFNRWKNIFSLETKFAESEGLNFVFQGLTDPILIPYSLWTTSDSPLSNLISELRLWYDEIPQDMSWSQFQLKLSEKILFNKKSFLGVSKRYLEILRFYTSVFNELVYMKKIDSAPYRKNLFKIYHPIYKTDLNYTGLIKDYPAIIRRYCIDYPLPSPKSFNLACILLITNLIPSELQNSSINSLPIWQHQIRSNNKDKISFALHRIDTSTIQNLNEFEQGLVSEMQFFWNLNTFYYPNIGSKNARSKLDLLSPWSAYSIFENQGFNLNYSIKPQSRNLMNGGESLVPDSELLAANWQLHLTFPQNNNFLTSNQFEKIKFELNTKKIIRDYNLRYSEDKDPFHTQFADYSSNNPLNLLFKHRLYLLKLSPTVKGVLWLEFNSQLKKTIRERLKLFLTSWLFKGPLIETKLGFLIFSHFPKSILNDTKKHEIFDFFATFDITAEFILETDNKNFSPLFIYSLPYSKYYDENNFSWKLPLENIMPSYNELLMKHRSITLNEKKNSFKL